jgi:hypothetical protein
VRLKTLLKKSFPDEARPHRQSFTYRSAGTVCGKTPSVGVLKGQGFQPCRKSMKTL